MKKKYVAPQIRIIKVEMGRIQCTSGIAPESQNLSITSNKATSSSRVLVKGRGGYEMAEDEDFGFSSPW